MEKIYKWLRHYVVRLLKPLSVYSGRLCYPPHERLIRASTIKEMMAVVREGDVILAYSRGEFTNYFIKGDFKHAAMYVGKGEIIQAIGKGVTLIDFEDFCASKDRIAILRPNFCDDGTCRIAAMNAKSQLGKPFDYYFEIGSEAYYCAELIAWSYRYATLGSSPFIKKDVSGCETVLPSDFYLAKSKFTLVIERPSK